MTALFVGSTAIVITRPDVTAGPIDRALSPANASAGNDCAVTRGVKTATSRHVEMAAAGRSMRHSNIRRGVIRRRLTLLASRMIWVQRHHEHTPTIPDHRASGCDWRRR